MSNDLIPTHNVNNNALVTAEAHLNVNDILVVAVSRAEGKIKETLSEVEKGFKETKQEKERLVREIKKKVTVLVKEQVFGASEELQALQKALQALMGLPAVEGKDKVASMDTPDFLPWTASESWLTCLGNIDKMDPETQRLAAQQSLQVRVRIMPLPAMQGRTVTPEYVEELHLPNFALGKELILDAEAYKEQVERGVLLSEQVLEWKKKLAQLPMLERQYRAKLVEQALSSSEAGREILGALTLDLEERIAAL
ncbi:MAG: hypothetical protein LHW56_01865 [Candidatus Cloacimonetes bacterium]|nr:hypothetical protein [Candidatus Cloacimonadota bacterium]MDY0171634.1 hypothetical protein [Candidatus Cloacimonadaceae bacterium]